MTYLEIVNKVLKRLRENAVTTVGYNAYSSLIAEFVNDAKNEVENAWRWSTLRTSIVITADGSQFYDLSPDTVDPAVTLTDRGIPLNATLVYDEQGLPVAFDTTSTEEMQLREIPLSMFMRVNTLDGYDNVDKPSDFALSSSASPVGGDGIGVWFGGIPATARTYGFSFYAPQDELEDDDANLLVPWRPVVHLALLYALDERGEEIGEPGSKAWLRYENSLASAIAIDGQQDSYKTTFTVP